MAARGLGSLLLAAAVAACAAPRPPAARHAAVPGGGIAQPDRIPPFAARPYQPFARDDAVAIALREWRLFGQPVDDDPPGTRPRPQAQDKPERQPGLWQRVGEYWWTGIGTDAPEAAWTGKHDEDGAVFPATRDGDYAWSAAFIDYVLRIAGAGARFPYSIAHADYIDAAREVSLGQTDAWAVSAAPPETTAPAPGDLICESRTRRQVRFADLPAPKFPAHCDIVVARAPGQLSVIGGNVDDAVTMKHVPVTDQGMLADADGTVVDGRYAWFVVLQVRYDIPADLVAQR